MSAVHISEEEAVRDFASVLAKVDDGDEVTIQWRGKRLDLRIVRVPSEDSVIQEPSGEGLRYLSEFRTRHSEPIDSTKWD